MRILSDECALCYRAKVQANALLPLSDMPILNIHFYRPEALCYVAAHPEELERMGENVRHYPEESAFHVRSAWLKLRKSW